MGTWHRGGFVKGKGLLPMKLVCLVSDPALKHCYNLVFQKTFETQRCFKTVKFYKLILPSGGVSMRRVLEGTARYAGLLLAPAEGFGLRPRLFLPFGQKMSLLCCFGPFLAIFGVQ